MIFALTGLFIMYGVTFAVFFWGMNRMDKTNTAFLNALTDQAIRDKQEREQWAKERHRLLERIQRPEYNPGEPVEVEQEQSEPIVDELHLVGSIIEPSVQPEDDGA